MKKKEPAIALSKEQKAAAVTKIKNYIADNFDADIGSLQSVIFLDQWTPFWSPSTCAFPLNRIYTVFFNNFRVCYQRFIR